MLSQIESQQAALMGWQLCEVYDLKKKKLTLQVLPTDFKRFSSVTAMRLVTALAKRRDPVCVKALTLIAKHNIKRRK